jgi:hypothetical protein
MANPLPLSPPASPGVDPADEPAAPAAGLDAPFELDAGYDLDLKRQVRLQLPEAPPITEDEIELFSRLFGDIVDHALSPKERPQ